MIRLLDSYDIGDPKKLFCKTAFNNWRFRFKIDLRSQKGKRSIPSKRGFKEMKLCEAVKKWLWAIICKITSSGTKAFRRDWHPAVESQLSLCWLTKNHEKAWVGQKELCLNRTQRKAGRAQLFCPFGKQRAVVWALGFLVCPEKTKEQDESPLEGDCLTVWYSHPSGGKVRWEEPTAGVFLGVLSLYD